MPFLAPLVPFIGPALGIGGAVAKGVGAAREGGNDQRAAQQQQALQAADFNRQQPFTGARAGVQGDILANVQPFKLSGGGRDLSGAGGLSPALLSQGTRQIGGAMNRQALMAALGQQGSPFSQFDTKPYAPQGAGTLEKILGGVGLAGAGLDALGESGLLEKYLKRQPQAPPAVTNPAFTPRQPLF